MLVVDAEGHPGTTQVMTFLHYSPDVTGLYVRMRTADGSDVTLSKSHLIYAADTNDSASRIPR